MECRLTLERGRARLRVDGRDVAPLFYVTSALDREHVRRFTGLGVPVVGFAATCDFHLYGLAEPCWTSAGSWSLEQLDERLGLIFDACPDALVLPRVYTCSPPWWDAEHPDDLVVWDDGSTSRPLLHGAAKSEVPSLGSERWRRAMRDNLARFIRHVESGPWADRVIGYMVNSGNTEEWFHWGTMEGYLYDYNPQVLERFRAWLLARYGDEDGLSAAWGRRVRGDDVVIPGFRRRVERGPLRFRDPVERRDVVDFSLFFADLVAECVLDLAACVKETTGGRKLFGTFFGYLLELAYHQRGIANGGHLALHRLLGSDQVDFLASPSSYARRQVGEGYSMSMVPCTSMALHGKAFFHENDVRTHVLPDAVGFGQTETARQTCSVQWREYAQVLTRGQGMWWFDMAGGWFEDPAVRETIERIARVDRRARELDLDSSGVSEVALVVDDESMLYLEGPDSQFVELLCMQALELSRAGAPFDVILARDLGLAPPYKLLVLPNLFRCGEALRERIHAALARRRCTTLWVGGPGFVGDDGVDPANARDLCGFRLRIPEAPHRNVIETEVDGRPITYGTPLWLEATPAVDDADAQPRGCYQGTGDVGLARREWPLGITWFSGAPAVPGALLRHLAREAGVHRWVESDDAVYANRSFVALHARSSGVKTLRLPEGEALFDVEYDVVLEAESGRAETYLAWGDTRLFYRGRSLTATE